MPAFEDLAQADPDYLLLSETATTQARSEMGLIDSEALNSYEYIQATWAVKNRQKSAIHKLTKAWVEAKIIQGPPVTEADLDFQVDE